MQDTVSIEQLKTRIILRSERLLFADCLAHHFSDASHRFELISGDDKALDTNYPTVYIRDIGQKRCDTAEKHRLLAEAHQTAPGSRVLVLSSCANFLDVPDWIAFGAHGYFNSNASPALLTAATTVVAAGGLYIPEELTRKFLAGEQSEPFK